MGKPITDTPVLTGEDAFNFLIDVEQASQEAVSEEEYLRAKKIYEAMEEKLS